METPLPLLLLLPFVAAAAPTKTSLAMVSGYAGSSTLTNFPVLVKISEGDVPGFHYADCAAGGADLSFRDASGNALPFDVDTWDATTSRAEPTSPTPTSRPPSRSRRG